MDALMIHVPIRKERNQSSETTRDLKAISPAANISQPTDSLFTHPRRWIDESPLIDPRNREKHLVLKGHHCPDPSELDHLLDLVSRQAAVISSTSRKPRSSETSVVSSEFCFA